MADSRETGSLLEAGQRIEDTWTHLEDEQALPERGDVTVTILRFRRERPELLAREGRLGFRVGGEQAAGELGDALAHASLLVIEIPKFSDGRHYSLARTVRERLGWRGSLRAAGDVVLDQLVYMKRCGYSQFALRPGRDPDTALRLLSRFSLSYQGSGARPTPLFRRRAS